jgi:hypothetical protein
LRCGVGTEDWCYRFMRTGPGTPWAEPWGSEALLNDGSGSGRLKPAAGAELVPQVGDPVPLVRVGLAHVGDPVPLVSKSVSSGRQNAPGALGSEGVLRGSGGRI